MFGHLKAARIAVEFSDFFQGRNTKAYNFAAHSLLPKMSSTGNDHRSQLEVVTPLVSTIVSSVKRFEMLPKQSTDLLLLESNKCFQIF